MVELPQLFVGEGVIGDGVVVPAIVLLDGVIVLVDSGVWQVPCARAFAEAADVKTHSDVGPSLRQSLWAEQDFADTLTIMTKVKCIK